MTTVYPKVPQTWTDAKEHLRYFANSINGLLDGQSNNTLSVTLTADATTTTITDDRIHGDSVPTLTPKTASAATAAVSFSASKGILTLTHDSSSDTDRSFSVILFG